MNGRSLSFRVISFFFFMAAATSGLAQGPGGGPGASLQQQVTALQARVSAAEAAIAALQTSLSNEIKARMAADQTLAQQIQTLQAATQLIQALQAFISVDLNPINNLSGPHIIFTGANIHIRSGSGTTWEGIPTTGLGNLVIGYNEPRADLEVTRRRGAHNLVIGPEQQMIRSGGIVAGSRSAIEGNGAISFGFENTVFGEMATVSGGTNNVAAGDFATVSGGSFNTANGVASAVSGGRGNAANHDHTAISGGLSNKAFGSYATVSGGNSNTASGESSVVSGGPA